MSAATQTPRAAADGDDYARDQSAALGLEGDLEPPALLHCAAVEDADAAALQAQMEEVAALETYRAEVRLADALALDAAVARSLYAREEWRLLLGEDEASSAESEDAEGEDAALPAEAEAKPPPSCTCCLSPVADAAARRVLPCGHLYCRACVATRCGMAARDRSMLPAHCCKREFPTEYVREALPAAAAARYECWLREKDWTALGLDSDREYAQAARAAGARQCPGCGVGVQRASGCSRMRCACGHEFCFGCGARWKRCGCDYNA